MADTDRGCAEQMDVILHELLEDFLRLNDGKQLSIDFEKSYVRCRDWAYAHDRARRDVNVLRLHGIMESLRTTQLCTVGDRVYDYRPGKQGEVVAALLHDICKCPIRNFGCDDLDAVPKDVIARMSARLDRACELNGCKSHVKK